MADSKTRQFRSEEVFYSSGEVVRIRAVPPSKIDDLIELQRSLLSAFFYHGGLLGELLRPSNEQVWADMRKLSALVPLVGQSGLFLDVDKVDDLEEICRVFFTTTTEVDPEVGSLVPGEDVYMPSLIANLHGINFWDCLQEGRLRTMARLEAEKVIKSKAVEKSQTSLPVEDPALTPLPT
jgi:hypothetical protein